MAASMKTEQQSPSKASSQALATNQHSPRNMAKSGGNGSASGTYVSLGPLIVSKALQDGEKFVKWDEVSVCAIFSMLYVYTKR